MELREWFFKSSSTSCVFWMNQVEKVVIHQMNTRNLDHEFAKVLYEVLLMAVLFYGREKKYRKRR